MPFYGRRRRFRRRSFKRTIPGSRQLIPTGTRREIPFYAKDYSHRKLLHIYPEAISVPEAYYFNNGPLGGTPPAQVNSHLLNDISLGDGISFRKGNRIKMRWLIMRLGVQMPTTPSSPQVLAVTIIYDKEPFGTAMNFTDVYDSMDPLAQTNINNRDRFSLLYRKVFVAEGTPLWNGTGVQWVQSASTDRILDLKVPLTSLVTSWMTNAVSGSYTNMKKGALWIWFTTSGAPSGTGNFRVFFTHRISYVDDD